MPVRSGETNSPSCSHAALNWWRFCRPASTTRSISPARDMSPHANLYCIAEHLASAVRPPGGRAIDIAELAIIGRNIWADVAAVLRDNPA